MEKDKKPILFKVICIADNVNIRGTAGAFIKDEVYEVIAVVNSFAKPYYTVRSDSKGYENGWAAHFFKPVNPKDAGYILHGIKNV